MYGVLTMAVAAMLAPSGPTAEEIAAALSVPVLAMNESVDEARAYLERETFRHRALNVEAVTPENWAATSQSLRDRIRKEIVFRGEATKWQHLPTNVEWLDVIEVGTQYRIRKLRFQAVPGLWIPALLYEPTELTEKVPAVLNVNGHDSKGKASDYKQIRCINLAKRGIVALNLEWLGMGQLNAKGYGHGLMNQLDLCGTSGLAVFYLAMSRGIDILLGHEHVDDTRIAMTGLSGGGWQTIFLSSLDTRISLACPVAGYSSFSTRATHAKDLGDSEQTPSGLASIADYTDLTALLAPRYALLTYCQTDNCCFEAPYALPPLEQIARPIYERLGHPNNFRTHVNHDPGTHNYLKDNREAFYRAIGDYFYPGDSKFPREEIPSDDEVKTADQLKVPLPDPNADFTSLAKGLSSKLPRNPTLPTDLEKAKIWQEEMRKQLRAIVCHADIPFTEKEAASRNVGEIKARYIRLSVDQHPMTLPVIELIPNDPKETAIVIADTGKSSIGSIVKTLLESGHRVIVADLMGLGERGSLGYLYPLLFDSLNERPLGLQASELTGLIDWSTRESKSGKPKIVADGPRSSLAALVAVALAPEQVSGIEVRRSLGSLKELIESGVRVEAHPEAFCFGLLESMDVRQIAALIAPTDLRFEDVAPQAERQFNGLGTWFEMLGGRFGP